MKAHRLVLASTAPALLLALMLAPEAQSADCSKTCVEVRREGGELVITARRDPIRTVRPSISPSPTPTRRAQPRPTARPVKRRNFSDHIRELLPTGSFRTLPNGGALINEPLLVRSSGCVDLRKSLPILDTTVELQLHPEITWSWGDGQRESWSGSATRGAHIYRRAGRYLIEMRCQWRGWFRTPHSSWAPIPEGIYSTAIERVELFRAHVFFTE